MTKVVKVYLISEATDKDGKVVEYENVNKILQVLQKDTRALKNKTIQLCWEWNNFSSDYYKIHGESPKPKDILNYSLTGYIDDKLKIDTGLYSKNDSLTIRESYKDFNNALKDIRKGNISIIEYKSNQPLNLHNDAIKITYDKNFFVELSLLKKQAFKSYNLSSSKLKFKMVVKDNSTKQILERCIDGIYHISASQLLYDNKKKMWYLNLCYTFKNNNKLNLNEDKILGIDLGIKKALVASVYGDYDRLDISGREVTKFRNTIEKRRKELLKQTKFSGDGKVGHGIKTRCKSVDKLSNKISCFRDSTNHKYSRAVINYAIKKGCGTIQMEDLSGISEDAKPFLKNWDYFDLKSKIKYKAEEAGIKVIDVQPEYTSQRCSKCGNIDENNRTTQALFKCTSCGYAANADYNASQNLAIKDIDKTISEARANMKKT